MPLQDPRFNSFNAPIDHYLLPELFTFPFYYQAHPLSLLAAKELQNYLQTQQEWTHNFGLSGDKDSAIGKMFGVLLVQNKEQEIGYLSAFSGKLAEQNHLEKFVPPVFDLLEEGGFFITGQVEINALNAQIQKLEESPQISELEMILKSVNAEADAEIAAHRAKMIAGRKSRKVQRLAAQTELDTDSLLLLTEHLAQQSIQEKLALRDLHTYWHNRVQAAEQPLLPLTDNLSTLKKQRKQLSSTLQKKIFDQYCFLNQQGIAKSLGAIFKETAQPIPPAGSGECAAPKLLHYAFKHGLKPLALAEFWWGASPKSEVRRHGNFYPACQGKCQPILQHMLAGIAMDKNPLLDNPAIGRSIEIIYQDEFMLVINKPEEFLSVPGKNISDSVYLRLKQSYPQATGPLIVHRLDMSTSGLLVIALSKEVHKQLQKQFIKRTVKKRYVAVLDGLLEGDKGLIDLPLRVDLEDRPRQLVCYEYGKPAKTEWEVIERKNGKTKVYFYPITGRTHQLRVHAAHIKGLNRPIVGDDLYGNKAERLHLHAEFLELSHPVTREVMQFQIETDF